ncbi:MAG: T9SS type A sorting domain-containing protein [Candidatus Krumholzibacteria bacterium]|nr:T9SS type A sorting domain-containing protein [Candidatus Krumholzibacteria bacterium]MDH4337839.1 T9SS type A sorting domain-containing protein [Candidatus Krumholzibacteria bacterium]MDH5270606.1 T9SS type A sorting domain-containing protein [Candidatus Krumholzibacteria bacterium]
MPPRPHVAVFFSIILIAAAGASFAQPHPDDVYWVDPFKSAGAPNEYTDAIVPYQDGLLLGGLFNAVSDVTVLRIVRWDGTTWHPLSTGVGTDNMGLVHVIRKVPGTIYAGGMFDQLGPWGASSYPRWGNIARFDEPTETWLPLGDGTDRAVRGISVAPNGDVYCVGEFTSAGAVHAQGIARWDGSEWHDVGGSLGARARALAILATDHGVYVGGFFDSAGGVPVSYIARWDGTTWQGLGSGVDNLVTTIVEHDGKLYVGGAFTRAGGKPANRIAVWDGRNWSALGEGLGGPDLSHVRCIEIDIDQLYVTGTFTHAGGQPVGFITTWDGSAWRSLGCGANDQTKVALLHDGVLWVGGNFTQVGGKEIPYVAQWTKPGKNTITFERLNARRMDGGVNLDWAFTAYGPWVESRVVRRGAGAGDEVVVGVSASQSGELLDAAAAPDRSYDYTLIVRRENGTEARSEPVRVDAVQPSLWLGQNQPNPFNPSTSIRFAVPVASRVSLRVYDVAGRLVRTLADQDYAAGEHGVTWDGRDGRGEAVSAGVYFYRLAALDETRTRKMILLK